VAVVGDEEGERISASTEARTMPGIIMNHAGAESAPREDAHHPGVAKSSTVENTVHGINGGAVMPLSSKTLDLRNGVEANGASVHSEQQKREAGVLLDLPPEVRQLLESDLVSFPRLIQRAAQQCYSSLAQILREMSELPNAPLQNQVNVNGGTSLIHRDGDNKIEVPNKKLKMIQFTDEQQTIFAKLLIIAQWAPHTPDVRKLMQLWAWIKQQSDIHEQAPLRTRWLLSLSRPWKEPPPDIRTALEVLSTGKADWMPDVSCNIVKIILISHCSHVTVQQEASSED
jgi:hypothetical protein